MSTDSWIELAVVVVSLVILGLASLIETSLATVNRLTLRQMLEGRASAHRVQTIIDRPQAIRSSMLLIELVSALLIATMLARLFSREAPAFGLALALGVGAVLVLIFGRVVPAALANPDQGREQRGLLRIASILAFLMSPLALVADLMTRALTPLFHKGNGSGDGALDEEEVGGRTENGGEHFDIEEDEQEMITGVLRLEEATVREIMVPRLDIVAVPEDMPIAEVVDIVRMAGHSRIPVYRESIDTVVGVIYAKDLLRFVREESVSVHLLDLLRPAYFVPESKRIDELLRDLRQAKVHIAIVVDEYGGTAGLVTIEDIIEEIVGEIQDEYDREVPMVERVGPEEVLVDGRISVDEIADIFESDFAADETGTIGGFVQKRLGHIPGAGETLRADGLLIEVQAVEHHRIRKLRVARLPEDSDAAAPSERGIGAA